ncbi:multidrug efflux RND transporter permease subunit [Skermanella mucosa]|uniref:efflux RND transporter permease subunit n=1 Tax=Skermanella mucosa TaxID=1789672 RepID=UPI00192B704C|nr:multidrug efflux RND transporter permease subunit [Skermanella mucosa]UEM21054.1 multidrug efflux RND transporter permease subunit [Skermanella mucosa]
MKLSHLFIERPIFATVLSILITLIGGFAYFSLPVAQYPEIAPPTIVVNATYPGASAEVVADTVAAPLEQEINGVENMLYMSSQSTGDGRLVVTISFALGTDLDTAQVLVQNRVAVAEPRLPEEVRRLGVTVRKNSPDMLMVIHLSSPDESRDQLYISNYATLQVKDVLARLDGVGDVQVFGARDYAMRIWLDPDRIASRNLTPGEVVAALRSQNVQVASGVLNQPPVPTPGAFQLNIETLGRLVDPRQFSNIVVKTDPDGRVTRVRDIGRVELAAQDYGTNGYLDERVAVPLLIFQRPGSNALETAERLKATMAELSRSFPEGLRYDIVYNPTEFIAESVNEVIKTIFEAVILVVVVVILFLQTWRASIIPILAIPVSLVGTFTVLALLGYSLNTLSLFGLVLAIGIVVDDAIVVVENVERNLRQGMSPREAAHRTMDEVGGALIAIALVLTAVFIPAAFVSGISGQFFRQFAVTIAAATAISCFVSLTLSPALCALLFKPHGHEEHKRASPLMRPVNAFFRGFNRLFDRLAGGYGGMTRRLVRLPLLVLPVYGLLVGATWWQFDRAPTGFIPNQDQGYLITVIQLPPGASLARTDAVVREATRIILETEGIAHAVPFAGFDGATFTNASNAGAIFAAMEPFEERLPKGLTADRLQQDLSGRLAGIQDAFIITIPPPPVRGIGNSGGFKMMVQDKRGRGLDSLEEATQEIVEAANGTPGLVGVFSLFNTSTPKVFADIDRLRAQMLGVSADRVFETLEVYLGSTFVNEFNFLGRTYRVTAQADGSFRDDPRDIANLKTRNERGEMVPIGSVAELRDTTGPYRVTRYNLYPSTEVQGATLPGYSTGFGLDAMERIAAERLPDGFGYEWTELAYQERGAGDSGLLIFGMSVVFVFLLLAAQYESWTLPFSVILIVPMCLLAAVTGLLIRGMSVDILAQVGFVVLVGLAAKNAILIVEFAKQAEDEGMSRFDAAVEAARTRLRPILMTSFAFILGVVPLMIAEGAGAEMRQSLGTAVFYGMLGVTFFGLIFTPVFYTVMRSFARKRREAAPVQGSAPPAPAE